MDFNPAQQVVLVTVPSKNVVAQTFALRPRYVREISAYVCKAKADIDGYNGLSVTE